MVEKPFIFGVENETPKIKTGKPQPKKPPKKKRGAWLKILKLCLWSGLVIGLLGIGAVVGAYYYLTQDLPSINSLADYNPPTITRVLDEEDRVIAEFFKERRIVFPFDKIPARLMQAVVAAEDDRFFEHKGIDFIGIIRALIKNIQAGAIVQGGSTITQQVAKSFFLSPERSYSRKIKEAILAYRIEKKFSKEEILYLYLNQIYLGSGAYGMASAARTYFDKSIDELDLGEFALLAGLPQAPSRYSPIKYPDRAKQRQKYVLSRMVEVGYISRKEANAAEQKAIQVHPHQNPYLEAAPHYAEQIRQYAEKKYGEKALYTQGLTIHSVSNVDMQRIAREEIDKGLRALDKRQGFRGPITHTEDPDGFISNDAMKNRTFQKGDLFQGVVTAVSDKRGTVTVRTGSEKGIIPIKDMRWARKPDPKVSYKKAGIRRPSQALSPGDVIWVRKVGNTKTKDLFLYSLEQSPAIEAALVSMDVATGSVRVMVGGKDFKKSKFNRAVQALRQTGSAFKPIIYAAALDKGYTPATMMFDSPIVYKDLKNDFTWKPKNYGRKFHGPVLLRKALAKSLNLVSIKLMRDIGVDHVIQYARKLGVTAHMNADLSIALGSAGISLMEMTSAFSVFANNGYYQPPVFITRILDRDGNELENNQPAREKVIDSSTAYIMTSMLESVIREGTATRVRALGRPAAGKTGTTNDLYDAWFIGYTPDTITGVWVGFDDQKSLGSGEAGGRTASPIWLGFMKRISADKPVKTFKTARGVVFAKIDAKTGLLPSSGSEEVITECFKAGTVPEKRTPRAGKAEKKEDLYKQEID